MGRGNYRTLKKSVGIRLISADYPTLFRDDTDHSILRQGTDASRITLRVERDLVTGTPHFKLSYTGINTARAKEEIGPLRDFFKERSAFYGVWRIDSLLLPITANADPVSSKQPHAADTIVASLVNMTQFAIRRGALPQDARRFTSELVAKLPQRTKNPTNAWSEEELAIWSQGESLPHRVLHFITRKK